MRICLLVMFVSLALPARAAAPQTVRVEMREFAFRPSTIQIPANRLVRLTLTNRGQLAHQLDTPMLRSLPAVVYDASLHIETRGLDIVRLEPQATATIEMYIRTPGRYPFACTIEGHREAGMVGVFVVR